jgi:hypothetical protein
MADRSMLFAARALPQRPGDVVGVLGLSEFAYAIPTLYKLLVSVDPQPSISVIFNTDIPVAIAGSRDAGLARLRALRATVGDDAPAAPSLDEAIAYLNKTHIDHPYFLLEPGEILGLSSTPLDAQMAALMSEIRALKDADLEALARQADDPEHWAGGCWSHLLYFQPAGSEQPPLSADSDFLTFRATEAAAQGSAFASCSSLRNVYLEIDGDADALSRAFTALGHIPVPFTLTVQGSCERLPDTIARLTNARTLVLGQLGVRHIPDALAELTNLEDLYLQSNGLNAAPSFLRGMRGLKQLSLRQNPLGALPDWIGELENLEGLWLDECELRALPASLWTLPKLKALNLSRNPDLGALPDGIGNLQALEELIVYESGLRAVPDSLGKLPRLKTLFLGANKLTDLPRSLYDAPLETLSLVGNPLKKPGLFGGGPRFRAKTVHWK